MQYRTLIAGIALFSITGTAMAQTNSWYLRSDGTPGSARCPLMTHTAFRELQEWNKRQWELNNTSKRYNQLYGTGKGISELNRARKEFSDGQKERNAEYTQAYAIACNTKKSQNLADIARVKKRGERLGERILRATIQRSYNQAVLKKTPTKSAATQ